MRDRPRALMARPRLLVIDELSLGLAPLVVDQLLDLIAQINRDGTTVLLVEQDVQVALEHAHRGYVLETGRIVQTSPAADLLEDSADPTGVSGDVVIRCQLSVFSDQRFIPNLI